MTFDPQKYITKIKGKDYLEVKWRIVWFREDHPNGRISTDIAVTNEQVVVFKAVIFNEEGQVLATGHGSAPIAGQGVWFGRAFEKAETAAIGRALAHAGYGTQFAGEDEEEHLADSPIESSASRSNGHTAPPALTPPPKKTPASGYKEGQEVQGFLQSFEITDNKQVKSIVKLATTGVLIPVWSFTREEFVIQGYMDRNDPQWSKPGTGIDFHEDYPQLTLVANKSGYWDIKPNSLMPKALLGKTENIPF